MTSIKEIAKKVGVVPSTVSFVLNGKDKEMRISAGLADKIKQVAEEMGYRRNQVAVSLRTGKSKIIALIVDTISGSFFSALASTIEQEARACGYRVIYGSTGVLDDHGEDLIQVLHQYQVDGFLIIPSEGMKTGIKSLTSGAKPVVLLDSYFQGMSAHYVLVDNYAGVTQGVEHLIEHGYRKIAFVCNDVNMIQMHERKRGYVEALKNKKITFKSSLVWETKYTSSKEIVRQQIQDFLQTTKPDAVMFAANYLGVYGLEAIKNLELKIPADIGVVCFDDHDIFSLYPPGISSIRQPVHEIAKTAFNILMEEIKHPAKKKTQVLLKPEMISRHSV